MDFIIIVLPSFTISPLVSALKLGLLPFIPRASSAPPRVPVSHPPAAAII